jgi:hypothetical protein
MQLCLCLDLSNYRVDFILWLTLGSMKNSRWLLLSHRLESDSIIGHICLELAELDNSCSSRIQFIEQRLHLFFGNTLIHCLYDFKELSSLDL